MPSENPAIVFKKVTKTYQLTDPVFKLRNLVYRLKNGQIRGDLVEAHHNALDDISFTIAKGEKVAILGHNGSGKSTTLKLINQICTPSRGEVHVEGSVGGMIELAAGFQDKLTGRENIYLNTALHGWTRAQTEPYVDQIIALAELSNFIDVPIKWYSSGMRVRLGFSIAMAYSPDIVLLDEVLAVGDLRFRKKCIQLLQDYLSNKTVVFVSHSNDDVRKVCDRTLVLNRGSLVFDGEVDEGIALYEKIMEEGRVEGGTRVIPRNLRRGRPTAPSITIAGVRLLNSQKQESQQFQKGDPVQLQISFDFPKRSPKTPVQLDIRIKRPSMGKLSEVLSGAKYALSEKECARGYTFVTFQTESLLPAHYFLELEAVATDDCSQTARMVVERGFDVIGPLDRDANGIVDLKFSPPSFEG